MAAMLPPSLPPSLPPYNMAHSQRGVRHVCAGVPVSLSTWSEREERKFLLVGRELPVACDLDQGAQGILKRDEVQDDRAIEQRSSSHMTDAGLHS